MHRTDKKHATSKRTAKRPKKERIPTVSLGQQMKSHNGILRRMASVHGASALFSSHVLWTQPSDAAVAIKSLASKKTMLHQRTNHFPGLKGLVSKNELGKLLNTAKQQLPHRYCFSPVQWDLPARLAEFKAAFDPTQTYILKPSRGLQGGGIELVQTWAKVERVLSEPTASGNPRQMLAQTYITKPQLLEGFKFDFRVYVLLDQVGSDGSTTCYVFREGLTRLSTTKYAMPTRQNLDIDYMHLTNFTLNKTNANEAKKPGPPRRNSVENVTIPFSFNVPKTQTLDLDPQPLSVPQDWGKEKGFKRSMTSCINQLKLDKDRLWHEIDDIVWWTVKALESSLETKYQNTFKLPGYSRIRPKSTDEPIQYSKSRCFQFLGFDILMDDQHAFHLLEVNQNASFFVGDSATDDYVKKGVFGRGLELLGLIEKSKRYSHVEVVKLSEQRDNTDGRGPGWEQQVV